MIRLFPTARETRKSREAVSMQAEIEKARQKNREAVSRLLSAAEKAADEVAKGFG